MMRERFKRSGSVTGVTVTDGLGLAASGWLTAAAN